MTPSFFHPAAISLLWLQSRGRRRRMWRRFCQPRRLVLSAIACILAAIWLGNALMTIWLRESGTPETLQAMLSLGLVLYAGWHLAKAAFFRPESPFDWTPAERELLSTLPLRSRDLVAYQLASVTVTTFLKAGLFALLLLPDLRCVSLGLLGVFLVMMALELLRIAVDITTWGMQRSVFLAYRAAVVAGLVATGFAIGSVLVGDDALGGRINIGDGLLVRALDLVVQVNSSVFGFASLPLSPFIDLILAQQVTLTECGLAAAALAIVTALAAAIIVLHSVTVRRLADREKRDYQCDGSIRNNGAANVSVTHELRLRKIPRWHGAGALAWRQLVGAHRHGGSLLTAMIAPAVLASAPCFVIAAPYDAFLATVGTLAFYTFLLLPTALRFDFRRDLARLATLKSMPVGAFSTAVGQTLAPVLIATVFQISVLAFAIVARSLPPYYLLTAMLVMTPLNALVFGMDNLIYLLYPYRIQQEGLEIFLRTMLTFTGKGLVFAVGLAAVSSWGFASAALTSGITLTTGIPINAYAMFAAGLMAGLSLLAVLVHYALGRTYRGMNPIEDIPR
jgi:hypothetical protein